MQSGELQARGAKTDRLIDLLRKVRATCYLSGPSAQDYLDEDKFFDAGIRLEYKAYDYTPYQQCWGDFAGAVSIRDLIANHGLESRQYIVSQTPNTVAGSRSSPAVLNGG